MNTTFLLPHQRKALEHLERRALEKSREARKTIKSLLEHSGLREPQYEEAIQSIRGHARIALHFHPERLAKNGQSVAEGLLQEGIFKNQFETGISNGSPSAFPGGERDRWERHFFGGAYHLSSVSPGSRPKYGALALTGHPDGPSPRFGSCYFILHPNVSRRSSFTFGGSQDDLGLERTGTFLEMAPFIAAVLLEVQKGQGVFGVENLTLATLLEQWTIGLPFPFSQPTSRPLGNALDSFVEAQVHGPISLQDDVERLVADPSFLGTEIEEAFNLIYWNYDIQLDWHPGYTLPVNQVPVVFRGYKTRSLATQIAKGGIMDAAIIGTAANAFSLETERWKAWGTYEDMLTSFRRLWHVLVKYGEKHPAGMGKIPILPPNRNNSAKNMNKKPVRSQKAIKGIFLPLLEEKGTLYCKKTNVFAKPAIGGERVETITSDGQETVNTAEAGDFLVKNQTEAKEVYIVPSEDFHERYSFLRETEDEFSEYQATGEVLALELTAPLQLRLNMETPFFFQASWKEEMIVRAGDFLVAPLDKSEVYRIARSEFFETYERCE